MTVVVTITQEFAVVEMVNNTAYVALLGRQWLYDTHAIQDWGRRSFTLLNKNHTVRIPLVSHGPHVEKIMDNTSDAASSTTITIASSYSKTAYRAIHDPITVTDNCSHEPDDGGTLVLCTEDSTSSYMLHWLQEAYENSSSHHCYHASIIYDEEVIEDATSQVSEE